MLLPYSEPTTEGHYLLQQKSARRRDYSVQLNDGTVIEATGERSLQVSFNSYKECGLMVDLNFRDRALKQEFRPLGEGKYQGFRISEAWAREQHFYFGLQVQPAPDSIWQVTPGVWWLSLPDGTKDATISMAISGTSEEGAWKNFNAENALQPFHEMLKHLRTLGIGQEQSEEFF